MPVVTPSTSAAETFNPANVQMLAALNGNIPVEYGQLIAQDVMANSVMMQLAKYVPMTMQEKKFDVMLDGLGAYWVGEGQRIQTTKPTWTQVTMTAHKMGVIVPFSREYINYKMSSFFDFMKPYIAEALYKKFDAATILNVDNPFTQSVEQSAVAPRAITGDITSANWDKVLAALEGGGFEPNAVISKVQNRTAMRAAARTVGTLTTAMYDQKAGTFDGLPLLDVSKDLADMKTGTMYAGDFGQAFYGIPYNMAYAISTDATLTTIKGKDNGPINLFERELAALRVTWDVAFLIVKPEAFASIKAATV